MKVSIKQYQLSLKKDWDFVLDHSINGTFLHRREFLEYHGTRFEDASLLIYSKSNPVAIFPAEREGEMVHSHRGLSYSGWILIGDLDVMGITEIVNSTIEYFQHQGVLEIIVKMVPDFFAKKSQESLKLVIESNGGEIIYTAIHHCTQLPFRVKNKGKKWGKKKAILEGVKIKKSNGYGGFWEDVLIPKLTESHQVKPTHDLAEIRHLVREFPNNIHLYTAEKDNKIVAGAVIFETETCAHLQYIAANKEGQQFKALDFLMTFLLEEEFLRKAFFNMGVSHVPKTGEINKGLEKWKESLGGIPVSASTFKWDLTHLNLRKSLIGAF